MDKYRDNKNVLFIVTTNSSKKFNDALLTRFEGGKFTVGKPNEQARARAIKYLLDKKFGADFYDDACIKNIAYYSSEYTYRQLEDLAQKIFYYSIDSGKSRPSLEEIKKLMVIYYFYHNWLPQFRGCHMIWEERSHTERLVCMSPYLGPYAPYMVQGVKSAASFIRPLIGI